MAATLGALGIGLCVVFGGFIAVLVVEVYYIILHSRHRRELQANSMASGERGLIFNLNQAAPELLGLAYWRRRLKYGVSCLISRLHDHHNRSNQQSSSIPALQMDATLRQLQASSAYCPPIHPEFVATLFPLQGDSFGDADILHLLGPPRLLFTIKEETREDLVSEDAKSKTGRSRGGDSTPSSEFLPQLDSDSVTPLATPFVTPPSTPSTSPPMSPPSLPLQQEQGKGGEVEEAVPSHLFKPLSIFIDESSSSFSSSSSENITPPIPSSPPRNPLSTLMEETSSSSSSSMATPFDLSPPVPAHSPKRGRGSLGSFLDIPSQNRVYPLEGSCFKSVPPIGEHHLPRGNFVVRNHFEGIPFLGVSAPNGFGSSAEISEAVQAAFPSRQFQHPSDFPSSPSPPWPPSPPTPPLHSALSSPVFTSPSLNPVDSSIAFNGP